MTDEIRKATIEAIRKKGKTKAELARELNMDRQYLADLLSGKSGNAPKRYMEVLKALGLELTVTPKSR